MSSCQYSNSHVPRPLKPQMLLILLYILASNFARAAQAFQVEQDMKQLHQQPNEAMSGSKNSTGSLYLSKRAPAWFSRSSTGESQDSRPKLMDWTRYEHHLYALTHGKIEPKDENMINGRLSQYIHKFSPLELKFKSPKTIFSTSIEDRIGMFKTSVDATTSKINILGLDQASAYPLEAIGGTLVWIKVVVPVLRVADFYIDLNVAVDCTIMETVGECVGIRQSEDSTIHVAKKKIGAVVDLLLHDVTLKIKADIGMYDCDLAGRSRIGGAICAVPTLLSTVTNLLKSWGSLKQTIAKQLTHAYASEAELEFTQTITDIKLRQRIDGSELDHTLKRLSSQLLTKIAHDKMTSDDIHTSLQKVLANQAVKLANLKIAEQLGEKFGKDPN